MNRQLKAVCIDDEWIESDRNISLGKLLFNHGILNLQTGEFTEHFDPEVLFFNKIQIDYDAYNNEEKEYTNNIYDRLLLTRS